MSGGGDGLPRDMVNKRALGVRVAWKFDDPQKTRNLAKSGISHKFAAIGGSRSENIYLYLYPSEAGCFSAQERIVISLKHENFILTYVLRLPWVMRRISSHD